MILRKLGLVIGLCWSIVFSASAQNMPNYQQVVEHLEQQYNWATLQAGQYVSIGRFGQQWMLSYNSYSDNYEMKKELLWKPNEGFVRLPSVELKVDGSPEMPLAFRGADVAWYARLPYYGYQGYYKDLIKHYEQAGSLSIDEQYYLGRAYSEAAGALLHNDAGFGDPKDLFDLSAQQGRLDDFQFKSYQQQRMKAARQFAQIASQQPDYMTIVGPIGVKAANEYMTGYVDMQQYGVERYQQPFLAEASYPDLHLSFARNLLYSCDYNAYLITQGDNDTYPVLYIQAKEGIRKDVTVANINLLAKQPYVDALAIKQRPQLRAKAHRIAVTRNGNDLGIDQALDWIANPRNVGLAGYVELPSRELRLSEQCQFALPEVMHANAIANLSVLEQTERPIHYAVTTAKSVYFDMPCVQEVGLTKKVSRNGFDAKQGLLDSYEKVMYHFDFNIGQFIPEGSRGFDQLYRSLFLNMADQLNRAGEQDRATRLLDKCFEVLPTSQVPLTENLLFAALIYADAGQLNQARDVATALAEARQQGKLQFQSKQTFSMLQKMADHYQWEELKNKLN